MRKICLAFLGLMLLAGSAAASDGKQAAARATEAAQALQQQAEQAIAAGKRLDFTTGPASEHLRRVFDAKSLAELPPVAVTDMPWITDWLGAVRSANYTLMYFGADPKRPMQIEPAAFARNVHEYEDQIADAITFQHRLFPRAIETTFAFYETLSEAERTPVRIEGIHKMIRGYLESVSGAIGFAADSTTKPANSRMIAAVLRETADAWITFSEAEERKSFIRMMTAAQQQTKDKETARHFRAMQAALEAAKS